MKKRLVLIGGGHAHMVTLANLAKINAMGHRVKVGVYAVRQNPVLYHNLVARLEGDALMPFDPGGDYLLIFNLGGGVGVLKKRWLEFGGRPAFLIKDYIDRKFMREFQAIE